MEQGGLIARYRESGFDWVFDAQAIFRCLVEGLTFPGKLILMPRLSLSPPEPRTKYVMGALLTLLDQQVSFCVCGRDADQAKEASHYIQVNTNSSEKPLEEADYVFFLSAPEGEIRWVSRGTLEEPHKGAGVFYLVQTLSEGITSEENAGASLQISGPGIRGIRRISIEGIAPSESDSWMEIRREYPLGIDIYLISQEGHLCGLPRSTKIEKGD
ncbi:phosphonate C-P lyase system protein PhnH [Dehalococcoidia bacterium]|nr:phosphonate C-P lyase system protein PhnH [Dehalococcoidia bacterium]